MQDKVQKFLDEFKSWTRSIGIPNIKEIEKEEIEFVSNCSYSDFLSMSIEQLNDYYFNIMKFTNSLQISIREMESILEYCESSINYIICDKVIKMSGDLYIKNDLKVMYFIKNDEFCKQLLKVQLDTKSKVQYLKDRFNFFSKLSDMIDSIIKRKTYDRSN